MSTDNTSQPLSTMPSPKLTRMTRAFTIHKLKTGYFTF